MQEQEKWDEFANKMGNFELKTELPPAEDDKEYREWVEQRIENMKQQVAQHDLSVQMSVSMRTKEYHATQSTHLTRLIADIKKGMEHGEAKKPIIDNGSGHDARIVAAADQYAKDYGDGRNNSKLFITYIDAAAFAYNLPAPSPADLAAWQQQKKGGGE